MAAASLCSTSLSNLPRSKSLLISPSVPIGNASVCNAPTILKVSSNWFPISEVWRWNSHTDQMSKQQYVVLQQCGFVHLLAEILILLLVGGINRLWYAARPCKALANPSCNVIIWKQAKSKSVCLLWIPPHLLDGSIFKSTRGALKVRVWDHWHVHTLPWLVLMWYTWPLLYLCTPGMDDDKWAVAYGCTCCHI